MQRNKTHRGVTALVVGATRWRELAVSAVATLLVIGGLALSHAVTAARAMDCADCTTTYYCEADETCMEPDGGYPAPDGGSPAPDGGSNGAPDGGSNGAPDDDYCSTYSQLRFGEYEDPIERFMHWLVCR